MLGANGCASGESVALEVADLTDYPHQMTASPISGVDFGGMLRRQREARGLDVAALAQAIGGTPSPGFLTSLEDGAVEAISSLVLKLSSALGLPADLMLNAAGFATQAQRAQALADLAAVTDGPVPQDK